MGNPESGSRDHSSRMGCRMNSHPDSEPPDPLPPGAGGYDADWEAWLAFTERCEDDEPPAYEEEDEYPEDLAEILAEAQQAASDAAASEAHLAGRGETGVMGAVASALMGRRGPGMPGSACPLAGEYSGPGGGFATGQALDVAPGGP